MNAMTFEGKIVVYKFIVVKCMNNSKNMEARHILSSGYGNFRVYWLLSTTKLYFILVFVVLDIEIFFLAIFYRYIL